MANSISDWRAEGEIRVKDGPRSENGESDSTGGNRREMISPNFGDLNGINFYHVVGVDQHADADTLAEAYARLRAQHHSQREGSEALAAEIVRYLDSVYAVLIDPERRHAYDAPLIASETSTYSSSQWVGANGGKPSNAVRFNGQRLFM
jgi:hypothetical protein